MKTPLSTYRLQLGKEFPLREVKKLIPYLHELGITHCYFSPLLQANAGSQHGYDIVNHHLLNKEIGTESDLEACIHELKKNGMGVILDIVPNHMYVKSTENLYWQDVLENGPSSPYADFFDIDWQSSRSQFKNKVLLPFLDKPFGECLENQEIRILFLNHTFVVEYHGLLFPTDPRSWIEILSPLKDTTQEIASILTALEHLPTTTDLDLGKVLERQREKEVIKKRLAELNSHAIEEQLKLLQGKKGDPRSFDRLEHFLEIQPYRLAYWKVANEEINFRRFFDIYEYAGLRVENPKVFLEIHRKIFEWVEKKWIDGLRIDHIDGLYDPEAYIQTLREKENVYLIVEKILLGKETLRPEWKVQGTVGYDFLNLLNGLYVYAPHRDQIIAIYQQFTGEVYSIFELSYYCKKYVLKSSLSSEVHLLARKLDRIAQKNRASQDLTFESLKTALRDVIACFPVYRSYVRAEISLIHEEDRQYILTAVAWAKRRNPEINTAFFHFIQNLLLLEHPPGLNEDERKEREAFVMKFQQVTGPAMAKGLEDTAFYRLFPLATLNEVGSDLTDFGISIENFHLKNSVIRESFPETLLATSTHDTKRNEDVRARINVLSEIPKFWHQNILDWSRFNRSYKTETEQGLFPTSNDEYLFYQILIGSFEWPISKTYIDRVKACMSKSIKEAKLHTSWLNPNEDYDKAMDTFVEKSLSDSTFLHSLQAFMEKINPFGMLNSLSQVLLKCTLPGIPDIYQGNEIFNFALVDPDNRRPIDYALRQRLLQDESTLKLHMTKTLLHLRKQHPDLFLKGSYLPLKVHGPLENHFIAFARIFEHQALIVISGRFFTFFMKNLKEPLDTDIFKKHFVELPKELEGKVFRDVFNRKEHKDTNLDNFFDSLPMTALINS